LDSFVSLSLGVKSCPGDSGVKFIDLFLQKAFYDYRTTIKKISFEPTAGAANNHLFWVSENADYECHSVLVADDGSADRATTCSWTTRTLPRPPCVATHVGAITKDGREP
jgi:hypothetical protein